MYWGSVRFFKHVILGAVALLILVPTTCTVVLGVQNSRIARENVQLRQQVAESNMRENNAQSAKVIPAQSEAKVQIDNTMEGAVSGEPSESIAYQELYPEMYCNAQHELQRMDRTIYLTFDDGPSERTQEILSILQTYGVKATFFVVGEADEPSQKLMRQIVDDGHTLGIHSYTHKYKEIYASVESFLEDFHRMYEAIYEATGQYPEVFRFPGGSVNSYNTGIYQEIIAEMTRRGFLFYDWNLSAADASSTATKESITDNILQYALDKARGIVLMHDSTYMYDTVAALPGIIEGLQGQGFQFERITHDTMPITFAYID